MDYAAHLKNLAVQIDVTIPSMYIAAVCASIGLECTNWDGMLLIFHTFKRQNYTCLLHSKQAVSPVCRIASVIWLRHIESSSSAAVASIGSNEAARP